MEQSGIENIFIQYIREKYEKNCLLVKNIIEQSKEQIRKIEKARKDLENFHQRHKKELDNIFADMCVYYFCSAYNDLRIHEDSVEQWLEHELKQIGGEDGYVYITYDDFQKDLGVSKETAKKYCELLIQKEIIERKRVIQGYLYKFVEK